MGEVKTCIAEMFGSVCVRDGDHDTHRSADGTEWMDLLAKRVSRVCTECFGEGTVIIRGSDLLSVEAEDCPKCRGLGNVPEERNE